VPRNQQALLLNRRHRSAHEHLGELYLVIIVMLMRKFRHEADSPHHLAV
jgi:hypothetical protein